MIYQSLTLYNRFNFFQLGRGQRKNNLDTPRTRRAAKGQHSPDLDRDECEVKVHENSSPKPKTLNVPLDYRDVVALNLVSEKNNGVLGDIPMTEFSRNRQDSPVKVHRSKDSRKETVSEKEIQSPDYGVEADMKETSRDSFYDLIGEGEDGFKFADDDDEYVDNKVTV